MMWGVNELDEAWPASYALDLVRLATSAYLAISGEHLCIPRRQASEAIEEGYRDALAAGGKAFFLGENHPWGRVFGLCKFRDPLRGLEKMAEYPAFTSEPPPEKGKMI